MKCVFSIDHVCFPIVEDILCAIADDCATSDWIVLRLYKAT